MLAVLVPDQDGLELARLLRGAGFDRTNETLENAYGSSKWARLDSNQGPTDYESAALTS